MNRRIPTWLLILFVILAPIGLAYLILHTMSRDFKCFLTVILVLGIGMLLGIWIISPETIEPWLNIIINIFN